MTHQQLLAHHDQLQYVADELYDVEQIMAHVRATRQRRSLAPEIEQALARHPAVRDVAVLAEDGPGWTAYVVVEPLHAPRIGGRQRFRLPNNMAIVHTSTFETDYLYQEIFEERVYLRHGVALPPDACVLDVGANVGLFSLYVQQVAPQARILAFEPAPPTFAALAANATLYGPGITPLPYGLAERRRGATLTFYPSLSIFSGYYADAALDAQAIKADFDRQLSLVEQPERQRQYIEALLEQELEHETYETELRPLSQVIGEHALERIDLLKVDVERSELDVMAGIAAEDWPRIQQIVLEVHDDEAGRRCRQLTELLEGHGYQVVVDQEAALRGSQDYLLYARRATAVPAEPAPEPRVLQEHLLSDEALAEHLQRLLPEARGGTFVYLDALPRRDGALDLEALPRQELSVGAGRYVAPRTPTEEQVARIWAEVLGLERVGIAEDFFQLGGHSMLATQILFKVHEAFSVEVPLSTLFGDRFTVAELARVIDELLIQEAAPDELARMLDELDGLSDEEIRALLESELES